MTIRIENDEPAAQTLSQLLAPQDADPTAEPQSSTPPALPLEEPPADEPAPAAEPAPTEPEPSEPSHPDSKIYDILGDNIVADNVYNTVDIAKSVAATPLKIGNDVLNAGIDAVNAGLRFFDDEDDGPAYQIPNNRLPEFLEPQTAAGKFAQTAASWYLGGKIIDTAVAARAIASSVTMPGRIEQVRNVGNAIQELGRVITGPRPYTGQGAVAEYAKEAVKDFILNSPQDDTLATYLKETGMVDHPFFDLMAIEDDDDYLIRRMKHSLEGGVTGVTLDAAFEAGRAGMKLLKWLGGHSAEAAEITEAELKEMLDKNPWDYANNIGQRIRSQLFDQGLNTGQVDSTMHLLESYAAQNKRADQSIKQYLEELNVKFQEKAIGGDLGKIRLETGFKEITETAADLGAYLKENPIEIALNITNDVSQNPGTILHEFSHFFMWDAYRQAHIEGAGKDAIERWERIATFVRFQDGQTKFDHDQCEKFAHRFEEWILHGKAPNDFLANDFSFFRDWVRRIDLDGKKTNARITENMQKMYGSLFIEPDFSAEKKMLYEKGVYVDEAAKDIVEGLKRSGTGSKEEFSRAKGEVPNDRRLRTGAINFKFLIAPDELKIVLRQLEDATAEFLSDHITKEHSWDAVRREAVDMFAEIVSDDENAARILKEKLHNTETRDTAAYVGNYLFAYLGNELADLCKLYNQADAEGLTEECLRYAARFDSLSQTMLDIRLLINEEATAAARFMNSLKIPISLGDIETADAKGLAKILEGGINGHDTQAVMKRIGLFEGDTIKTMRYLQKLNEPWTRKSVHVANEVYTNSLLSNPATFIVNLVGNAIVTGVAPLEYLIGGYISKGLSAAADVLGLGAQFFRNDGDEALRKGNRLYMGIGLSWKDARDTACAAWKNEASVWGVKNSAALLEYGPERWIQSGTFGLDPQSSIGRAVDVLGRAINIPSKMLMTGDDFFKSLNGRAMLFADLWEEALSKNITKEADIIEYIRSVWDDRVIKHIKDGTLVREVITDDAARDFAMKQTFSNDTGGLARLLAQYKEQHPLLHPLIPFVRTPARLLDWTVQRTPLGLLYKQQREAVMRGGAEASKILGQWAVGGVFIGSAVMLAQSGRLTGGGPSNPQARKAMQDLGWQPYSIKVGNKWYSYNRLDPLGSFFGIVGDYLELAQASGNSEEDARTVMDAAQAILLAVGKNLSNKTYLQNIGSLISIIENPDISGTGQLSAYASQIAQGFVPRIVTNLARDTGMTDPYMREASGFIDRLKARTPGLGEDVPLQYSWLTGEARAFGSWSLFNFTPVKESVDDQIHAELLAYGAKLGGPSRTQNGIRLSDEQYSRLCELHGTLRIGGKTLMQALEALARSASYRRLPEGEERMKELNSVIGRYRSKARAQLNREFPELAPKPRWRYTEQTPETDLQKLIRYGQS